LNKFAISSGGLGEALERSASSLAAANNTLHESAALITAANEVVQNPEKVGTAFKTISMRIRGAKTELEEAGESTEGMVESTATLRAEMMALSGVDIMLNKDTFKSTYQIMDELSQRWENLSDIQQATITELMAGKHQGNVFASLMTNFDTAREALDASLNSSGSAMREHAKWSESLEARLNKLKSTWQSLSQTFMGSDFLKGGLDLVIGFVNALDKLIDTIGILGVSIAGLGIKKIFSTAKGVGGLKSLTDILPLLSAAFPNAAKGVGVFTTALKGGVGIAGVLKAALSGLWTVVAAHPILAVVAAVGLAIAGFAKWANQAKELAEKVDELTSKYKEQHTELVKNKSSFKSQATRYAQLAKGVGTLGENVSLTTDEYAEYQNIVNSIADKVPSLVKGYDAEGNAILDYTGNVKQLTAAYEELIKKQNESILKDNYKDIEKDFKNAMNAADRDSKFGAKTNTDAVEAIEEIFSNKYSREKIEEKFKSGSDLVNIVGALKDAGFESEEFDVHWWSGYDAYYDFIADAVKNSPDIAKEIIGKFEDNLDAEAEGMRTAAQAALSKAFDFSDSEYKDINDKTQNLIRQIVGNFDAEQFKSIVDSGQTVEEYVNNMIDSFKNMSKGEASTLEAAFNLQTKFNGGEISYGEYVQGLQDVSSLIDKLNLDEDIKSQIKLTLGLSEKDGQWVLEEYETLLNRLTSEEYDIQLNTDSAETFLKNLSASEVQVAVDFIESDNADFKSALQNYKDVFNEAKEVGVDFSKTVFGNIDTNARQTLEWTSGNLKRYKDELMSWEPKDASWDKVRKDLEGSISTVMGTWETFDIGKDKKVPIAFSPMLQTDKGAEVLSNGTVNTYISQLISKATEDGKWDKKELIALDSKGLEVDGQKIKGILADVGETAEATAKQMHFVGKDGALALAEAEINAIVETQAAINEAMNFTIAMDVETESLTALNTAMAESVSGAGLSSEAIAALKSRYAELEGEGYNLSAMFEETANGIHLNKEAVGELEQKLASDKLAETDKQLEVLKGRYDELTTEINNCTDASDRAALYTEQQSIVDKINDLATLASQYEGLTSAYNAWLAAEEAGSERDMYENIIQGFETVEDEISRGWIDDGTIKFLELLTGKTDLAGKSGKQLKEIYDGLDNTIKNTSYSISDFFTVDEDGNSTNTGVYNFLNAVHQLEKTDKFKGIEGIEYLSERDENGNVIGFNFELVAEKDEKGNIIKNGDQVIAEALGISEELVQIMLRAADDAGFVVNLEGAYTQLADLKTEAESARDTLISLQKNGLAKLKGIDVNFDLEAEGNDLLEEQGKAVELLNKFKDKNGKIDLKMEGAQQALDIAEYLTIKLDDLTEPKIMQIDVSEVDEDLRDPIEKMQEIVKLSKEKNLVSLTGDKKEIKETQSEINKVAKELEELDPEIKAKVGIDEDWDAKTIASKIEKGEVEIPAELELDVQMSDDLKDMRLMMMNQLGLVSDDEVKLKVGFDIDESIVDNLTDEQKEVVVKYLAEHEEVDDYTPEQKEALVKYIADGGNLDSYTPEEKQGIVKYLADGGNITDYTPEQKQAIVEYLTDSGDPDSWTPEQKEAVAKFKKDSAEVDNYSPEDKQAIAKFIKDSIEPDTYQPPNKTQEVVANLDSSEPDNYQPKDKKFTVKAVLQKIGDWTNKLLSGGSKRQMVNGTANANGTTGRAFKQGDWRTKKTETALTGELGRELVVTGNRWYTVGDHGAEFTTIPKGSIVFNHRQTEELFKNGKITSDGGRGRMLANGTAFASGTAYYGSSGTGGGLTPEVKSYTVKTSKDTKDTTEDFEETFDLIEIAISRIERAIDQLDQKANRTYKSWSSRNSNLTKEITRVNEEINLQNKAYNKYMAAANAVGLSSKWKNKVKDGSIDISTIKDEAIAEKIKDYQSWYEKALACKDAILDLQDAEAELYKQKFDNIVSKYDDKLGVIDNKISSIEQDIEQSNYTSAIGSNQGNYKKLVGQENNNIAQLEAKNKELQAQLDKSVKDGVITKYSEDWYSMREEIDATTLAIKESTTNISQYYRDMFDEVSTKYDAILQGYEHTETMLNEYISQAEAQGHIVSEKYYNALINNEKQNILQLKKEQSALIKARDEAVKSGAIKKNSAEWYGMCQEIDSVTQAIEEGRTSLIEYNNAIREIDWSVFDLIQERISDVTAESEFLIELMSNDKLFDDKGKLTGQGAATMGLHALNYNTAMYQSDEYGKEIASLDKQIAKDPYDQELINRRRELIELQRESILAAEDEKQAIKDLVQEGIDKELDALQELIDKKNESLESEKDLYEYQKKVQEQTENIASLRKQIGAYENDNSEEAKAKLQELRVSLSDAETELKETEWDKYIQDTEQILDTFYTEYETTLNTRLDNVDYLLEQVVTGINASATAESEYNASLLASLGAEGTLASALGVEGAIASAIVNVTGENGSIKNILNKEVTAVGTTLSSAMNNIWNTGDGNIKSVLSTYGTNFQNQQTTTNTVLNGIKVSVDKMANASDKEAEKKTTANKTTTSAKKDPTKDTSKTTTTTKKPTTTSTAKKTTTTTKKTTTTNTKKSSGDGKAKVGDKVKFVSGQYYYDSQGKSPLGYHNRGKQVYITSINTASWATHPYHISTGKKLGSGDLGWLKLNQLSGYASGKYNFSNNEWAWTQEGKKEEYIIRPSDGAILTPVAKGDSVLNATASGNIWSMANNPAEFIRDNLRLDASSVPNSANIQSTYHQTIENVTFSMPNVHSYDETIKQMQKDKSFEKLIMAMTIDQIAGKSSLAKGKSIR
jgi:hypothetical protein